jgi:hypothetical protein
MVEKFYANKNMLSHRKYLVFLRKFLQYQNSVKMVAKKLKVKAKDLQSYMLGVGLVFWGGCA